jgi:hypothetical protein
MNAYLDDEGGCRRRTPTTRVGHETNETRAYLVEGQLEGEDASRGAKARRDAVCVATHRQNCRTTGVSAEKGGVRGP